MRTTMCTSLGRAVLTASILGILAHSGMDAQQNMTVISYRATKPGKGAELRKFFETSWKRINEVRVENGDIAGAMVLRLTAPYSTGSKFQYAVVNFPNKHPSLAPGQAGAMDPIAKKAGFSGMREYLDALGALSSSVHSDWLSTIMRMGNVQAGNYIRSVRHMVEDDHMGEQMRWNREVMQKVYNQRMKEGKIVAWGFTTNHGMLHGAEEVGYNLGSMVAVKDADTLWEGPGRMTEARLKEIFPTGMSLGGYLNGQREINEHRKRVGTAIWEVVAVAGKMKEVH